MRNKWSCSLVLVMFFSSCASRRGEDFSPNQIPIHFLPCTDAPLVKVNIEGKECLLKLDLGATCDLMLKQSVLDQINVTTVIGWSSAIDIRGHHYQKPQFEISNIKMGPISIDHAVVIEEDLFFTPQSNQLSGRIGNSIFRSTACYFDLSHSKFYIGANVEEIREKHSLQNFVKIPLDTQNGLLNVDLMTTDGIKKFVFDTGSNVSVLDKSKVPQKSEKTTTQLELGQFGLWNFHLLDFPENWPTVDGILGMDFFMKHIICFDFQNQFVYLSK